MLRAAGSNHSRSKNLSPESGTTLIEMMISVGLLGMIFYGVQHLLLVNHRTELQSVAIGQAEKQASQVFERFQKYFFSRDIDQGVAGYTISGQGKKITLHERNPNNPAQLYRAEYLSQCKPISAGSSMLSIPFASIVSDISSTDPQRVRCLARVACPSGTVPQISVRTLGSTPGLPFSMDFPAAAELIDKSISRPVAYCMLSEPLPGTAGLRLHLEMVYVLGQKTNPYRVISRDRVLSNNNTGDLRIVP